MYDGFFLRDASYGCFQGALDGLPMTVRLALKAAIAGAVVLYTTCDIHIFNVTMTFFVS
jgi:hypothetical protein